MFGSGIRTPGGPVLADCAEAVRRPSPPYSSGSQSQGNLGPRRLPKRLWLPLRSLGASPFNMGAFGACYAKAHARHPGMSGRVLIGISVDLGGSLTARIKQSALAPWQDERVLTAARELVAALVRTRPPTVAGSRRSQRPDSTRL